MSQKFIFRAGNSDFVRRNCNAFLASLPDTKSWQVEVKQYRRTRSNAQLNSMFGVAYKAIMEATGLEGEADKQQLHRDFCGDFFGWTSGPFGHRRPMRTTTTNERGERDVIDTETQARMYDFIQRTAAEYGVWVPDPEPAVPEHARAAA